MIPIHQPEIFVNQVIDDRFEWATAATDDQLPAVQQLRSRVAHVANAAIVAGGLLVFGPVGWSSPPEAEVVAAEQVVVRLRASGFIEQGSLPAGHRSAAEQMRALFRQVPMSAAEAMPDPDYGL